MFRASLKHDHQIGLASRLQHLTAATVLLLERALFWFASALLVFLIVALFLQVFYRYVVGQPLAWSEEGARMGLVWFSMAAACMAAIEGQHFVFRWGTAYLPEHLRFWVRRTIDVLVAVTVVIVLKLSLDYLNLVSGQVASGTGLSMQVPYASVTFGAAILLFIHIAESFSAFLSLRTGNVVSIRERNEQEMLEHFRPSINKK